MTVFVCLEGKNANFQTSLNFQQPSFCLVAKTESLLKFLRQQNSRPLWKNNLAAGVEEQEIIFMSGKNLVHFLSYLVPALCMACGLNDLFW